MAIDQGRVSGAASGAQLGAKFGSVVPGVGTGIGAGIGAVVGAIFGGGKGTYAQTTGHRVVGTIGPDGFTGTAYGLASNAGQNYVDVLDDRYGFITTVDSYGKRFFADAYGKDAKPVSIDFTGSADGATFWAELEQGIKTSGKAYQDQLYQESIAKQFMEAPTVSGGATSPAVGAGIAAPAVTAQPQTIIVPSAAPAGVDSSTVAWGIGLALFTWWLSKQG